ncbi:Uncharacterised protein g11037 [Pycnogonum litorale]
MKFWMTTIVAVFTIHNLAFSKKCGNSEYLDEYPRFNDLPKQTPTGDDEKLNTASRNVFGNSIKNGTIMEKDWNSSLERPKEFHYYDINKDSIIHASEYRKMKKIELLLDTLVEYKDRFDILFDMSHDYCYDLKTGKFNYMHDTDKDEKINIDELNSYITMTRGEPKDDFGRSEQKQDTVHMFNNVDVNKDEYLSFEYEFQLFCYIDSVKNLMLQRYDEHNSVKLNGWSLEQSCDDLFRRYVDPKRTGGVTLKEMENIIQNKSIPIYKMLRDIKAIQFEKIDDANNFLTKREFRDHCINQNLAVLGKPTAYKCIDDAAYYDMIIYYVLKFDIYFKYNW